MNKMEIKFVLAESVKRWRNVYILLCVALFSYFIPSNVAAQQTDDIETIAVNAVGALNDGNIPLAKSQFEWIEENLPPNEVEVQMVIQYNLITCDMELENCSDAIKHFNRLASLNNEKPNPELMILAYCAILPAYEELKDWQNGDAVSKYLEQTLLSNGVPNEYKWDVLSAVMAHYVSKESYDLAISIWQNLSGNIEINESQLDELSLLSINVCRVNVNMNLAICYIEKRDYQEALNYLQTSLQYIDENTEYNKATIYYQIAECLGHLNNDATALGYYEMAVNSASEEEYDLLAKIGLGYGAKLFLSHEITEAIKQFTYVIEHSEEVSEYVPYCYAYLYKCYRSIGDTEIADKYAKLLAESMKTLVNVDNEQYSICLSTYGDILNNSGDYKNALIEYKKALSIDCEIYGEMSPKLFPITYSISALYLKTGNLENAESYIDIAITNIKGLSEYLNKYIEAIILKAGIMKGGGKLGKAISLLEVLADSVESLSCDEKTKINYYSALGDLYGEIGEHQKGLQYEIQAAKYAEQHFGTQSPDYAISMLNLSELYAVLGDKEKSLHLTQDALELIKMLYGTSSVEYYNAFKKLASRYHGDSPNEAILLYEQCLRCSEDLFGKESSEYADCLIELSNLRFIESADKSSLEDFSRALEIKRKKGKDNDMYYFVFQNLLNSYYAYLGDIELCYDLDKEYYAKVKQYIIDNFQNMIEWQREKTWGFLELPFSFVPARALESFSRSYIKLAYNALLLRKALLLTSTNTISKLVAITGNSELITLHEEINKAKGKLLKANSKDDYERIQNEIFAKQRREIEGIRQIGIITDFLDQNWEDVKNALKPGEVAIEFFSYKTQDNISYGALVLKSNSMSPEIIPLFNDEEEPLKNYKETSKEEYDYGSYELYRVVWDRLEKYCLEGVNTIYFAPDGILNTMPVEYLKDGNGILVSDKWDMYRLSSTREIIGRDTKPEYSSAVLYGGLHYNMDKEKLIAESRSFVHNADMAQRFVDLDNLRDGNPYLPGTKEEVQKISDFFDSAQIKHKTLMGDVGTEESFHTLENDVNIIHLATHGFFWSGEEAKKKHNMDFLKNSDLLQQYEDKAMLLSGLLFSGANIALGGGELPDDVEDGVLTAQELAGIDLGNVDLVVLSACQSGLGEISSEGVFGLQRGFKLAGAKTLLMSLWKVDDTATQMLMTEFYRNLLTGQSKIEALRSAQQMVKSKYADPYYWAAFILLDAIN